MFSVKERLEILITKHSWKITSGKIGRIYAGRWPAWWLVCSVTIINSCFRQTESSITCIAWEQSVNSNHLSCKRATWHTIMLTCNPSGVCSIPEFHEWCLKHIPGYTYHPRERQCEHFTNRLRHRHGIELTIELLQEDNSFIYPRDVSFYVNIVLWWKSFDNSNTFLAYLTSW